MSLDMEQLYPDLQLPLYYRYDPRRVSAFETVHIQSVTICTALGALVGNICICRQYSFYHNILSVPHTGRYGLSFKIE